MECPYTCKAADDNEHCFQELKWVVHKTKVKLFVWLLMLFVRTSHFDAMDEYLSNLVLYKWVNQWLNVVIFGIVLRDPEDHQQQGQGPSDVFCFTQA